MAKYCDYYCYESLEFVLDEFANEVSGHAYKKLDYSEWRDLVKKARETSLAKIEFFNAPGERMYARITYYDSDDYEEGSSRKFYLGDTSFGDFLFDAYYDDTALFNETTKELAKNIATARNSVAEVNKNEVKENKIMKTFNFDFGPVDGNKVRMSMYGVAIANKDGTFVAYNANTGDIMDVDVFNFDGSKFMYKMPVALTDVKPGDVIIHNRVPVIVNAVNATSLDVIDPYEGTAKTILPTKNMFNFNFVTKVVSIINFDNVSATNPFGNMLPFLLLSDNTDGDIDPMALAMMAGGNFGGNMDFASNPMMLYFLMDRNGKGGKNGNDLLPFLMLGAMKPAAPAPVVNTGA